MPKHFFIPNNTAEVKVTLIWTDPAGNPSALIVLVNNLDLRLVDSNNNEYFPWRLDCSQNFRVASRRDNNQDNIEQVTIKNPTSGNYSIKIQGKSIPTEPQNYVPISQLIGNNAPVIPELDQFCFPIKNASGDLNVICI